MQNNNKQTNKQAKQKANKQLPPKQTKQQPQQKTDLKSHITLASVIISA